MKQEDLLKLHKYEQRILDEFVRVCEKHDLCYFLIA